MLSEFTAIRNTNVLDARTREGAVATQKIGALIKLRIIWNVQFVKCYVQLRCSRVKIFFRFWLDDDNQQTYWN
jgi:hypothetical protein